MAWPSIADIRTRVRDALNESTAAFYTDAMLDRWINDAQRDIEQALLALGYSEKEANAALKNLPADIGVSDGIKQALKALAK